MPCFAKALLRGVLSTTPGNFLAEKTWNSSLKQVAKMGADPVLSLPACKLVLEIRCGLGMVRAEALCGSLGSVP